MVEGCLLVIRVECEKARDEQFMAKMLESVPCLHCKGKMVRLGAESVCCERCGVIFEWVRPVTEAERLELAYDEIIFEVARGL